MKMERKLAESWNYLITYEYETVYLYIKNSDKKIVIGDFYGDPEVAIISRDESYCAIGGCGIIIYYLKEPFKEFEYNKDCNQWKEVLRNPKDIWWIEDIIENVNSKTINIVVDTYDELRAGIYEVNLINYDVKKY